VKRRLISVQGNDINVKRRMKRGWRREGNDRMNESRGKRRLTSAGGNYRKVKSRVKRGWIRVV
jgi:hypothetical protein